MLPTAVVAPVHSYLPNYTIIVGYPESRRRRTCNSECSPCFVAVFSTRGGRFRLLPPLPYPPFSTSPGEGLPGGLLGGSCDRLKRRRMPNRLNFGIFIVALKHENVIIRHPMVVESAVRPSGETGAGGLAYIHRRRMSVSYSEAGMNVLADIWLVSHTFALASATRALEQAKTQCRPSSGEVEAGGHGS